jgi:hypothetical protein
MQVYERLLSVAWFSLTVAETGKKHCHNTIHLMITQRLLSGFDINIFSTRPLRLPLVIFTRLDQAVKSKIF